jgi:rubrerythrin
MADRTSIPSSDLERRRFVIAAGSISLLSLVGLTFCRTSAAAERYANSISALKQGVAAERGAYRRYVEFGRYAKRDGYKGLAYLYTALATSELIHAQNYTRVLATLGELVGDVETATVPVGTAKENLIYAAERELNSIEKTYPDLLKAVEAEGHTDSIAVVQYSWASHKQHLDIIEKIRRWSPNFFESVAKKIDEGTNRYFVCQICGSTVTEIPEDVCPVCKEPPSKYRLIPYDQFF